MNNILIYANLTIKVENTTDLGEDFTGHYYLTVKALDIKDLLDELGLVPHLGIDYDDNEKVCISLDNEFETEFTEEELILLEKFFREPDATIEVDMADPIIFLLHNMLSLEVKEFEIGFKGPTVFWLIHDIMHAKSDVTSTEIYVNRDIEEERLREAAKYLGDQDISMHFDTIKSICDSVYEESSTRSDYNEVINCWPMFLDCKLIDQNYIDEMFLDTDDEDDDGEIEDDLPESDKRELFLDFMATSYE